MVLEVEVELSNRGQYACLLMYLGTYRLEIIEIRYEPNHNNVNMKHERDKLKSSNQLGDDLLILSFCYTAVA